MIERIALMPIFIKGSWAFRISVSNNENIMVLCMDMKEKESLFVRFFKDEHRASEFIDECVEGKVIRRIKD